MRPLWTGAVGFGLVNIPVKLFSATASSNLDPDMPDKKIRNGCKDRQREYLTVFYK